MKFRIVLALLASVFTAPVVAQTTATGAGGVLLVLSKADLTLSTIDPATQRVLGRVPSGPDPHEVTASDDGRFAYIANYGGGSFNTITIVDLVGQKAAATVNIGALRGPHGMMFSAGKVWFTAEGAKVVGSLDPATREVDLVVGTGQNRTHMIWVSADGQRIVTSNMTSGTMSIIDRTTVAGRGGGGRGGAPRMDWDQTLIAVGRNPEGFDVSPDGKEIWAANAQDGTVSVVDMATKRVVDTIAASVTGANRLKFTPDGRHALVSILNGPDLVILDTAARREVKRLKIGRGAAGIQMQPDGARAFVASTPDDYVTIIDLKTLEVAGRLDAAIVGRQPDGMAWAMMRGR